MPLILIELDNQLKLTDIVVPLTNASKEEVGEDVSLPSPNGKSEAETNGILSPLIEVNNIVVRFDNVISFKLSTENVLPTLSLEVVDDLDLSKTLDTPKADNEVRILILPPFENAYKKINMTFFIDKMSIEGSTISIQGIYKVPDLLSTRFKSLGELNSYDLYKKIATETKLGFATNIEPNDCDKRYVYCNNKSYSRVMEDEIKTSGSEDQILDCWIDFWNNINLADVKERYETVDEDKDLLIWTTGLYDEIEDTMKRKPILTGAVLNNNPVSKSSELYVESYEVSNNTGESAESGTDKVECFWNMDSNELEDYLIMDGDVKKDVFVKHEYAGEVYGGFNYLKMKKCRRSYLLKMHNNEIKVTLKTPILALMRGSKVNFTWFNVNELRDLKEKKLKEEGFINENPKSNIPLQEEPLDQISSGGTFKLDKNVSGLYLITACEMNYEELEWRYVLTLNKPPLPAEDGVLQVPEVEETELK